MIERWVCDSWETFFFEYLYVLNFLRRYYFLINVVEGCSLLHLCAFYKELN